MEWTGLNELREQYLSFFESKGHLRLPSFSLVPQNDKSILLINAGMTPMKKYFTGEITPPRSRVTTCQKCIRTPDIENVGKTARHGTFFEMLGNFSFGDYFKHEATAWAWEFFTEKLKMPADKLYISVYLDDDEAYDIWTKEVGVAPDHMVRFGKEDNFWEHGAGPCGPCSEIYFDRGPEKGCGSPDCKVGCECDRYVEVWNLVFTQFENDGNNNYTRLAHPNIDTGMGLERLACVMQGVDNLFEVDTVQNIMKHIMSVADIKYHEDAKKDVSLRVITDHIRSTTFMIGDGVLPSNVGRGYVLRRLLRRAARHGRLIGIDKPFLADVAKTVIKENENAYPNLKEKEDYIIKVITMEEDSFAKTIDSGLKQLNDMITGANSKILSGADAFKLQDTFGFPIDLTKEILAENEMTVDEEEFNKLIKEAKAMARNARKDAGADAWKNSASSVKDLDKTKFTGYETMSDKGKILALIVDGERKEFIENSDEAILITDKTCFYAESGGQIGDTGTICVNDSIFTVSNTTKTPDGVYMHMGTLTNGEDIKIGDTVSLNVDTLKREAVMRNHTSAHLLQAALRKILGTHVEQAGQLVNDNAVRFDFTHFSALTGEELQKVETEVNNVILSGLDVITKEMPIEEAKKMGAMALFGEKYGDVVRVVKAGDFSTELCGGTHISNTAKIGLFKIVSESSVAAGVRRIEAVTGFGVLNFIKEKEELIYNTAAVLKLGNISSLTQKVQSTVAELHTKEKEIEKLKAEIANGKTGDIIKNAVDIKGVKVATINLGEGDANAVRTVLDSVKELDSLLVVVACAVNSEKGTVSFGCSAGAAAIKKGASAGNIVRETAKLAGGAGGGKPDMAMAGGKDITKTQLALDSVVEICNNLIK